MHCSIRYYSDFLLILARKQRQSIHGGGYIVKKRGKSFKKEEFKTKICGCQYFVVVLLYGWGSWTRTNDAGVIPHISHKI